MVVTRSCRAILALALVAAVVVPLAAAEHPRLLVDKADVQKIRARVQQEPYASMLRAIKAHADKDNPESTKSVLYNDRVVDLAALYVLTGQKSYATAAEKIVLEMVNDKEFWNNPGSKGLTRAGGALRASLAFDLCADAWSPANVKLVSQKLRFAAEGMMKSMGAGANPGLANNWQAVRYAGAGIAFLASDEPGGAEKAQEAYGKLKAHLGANLGDNGWNPEGIGYTVYPWQFTGPFGIAAQRAGVGDLRKDVKKAALTFWTTMVGSVSIPGIDGGGLRADLSDDHPSYNPGGTAGMAFWYAPAEQQPGIKFMYDYLCGPRGDKLWDSDSRGGLYSILYYPVDLAEKNPAEVKSLGLNYVDRSHGIALFRNRYKDENDIVAVVNGHSRQPSGCHGGPDTNTFRILGLGSCWVVGGGRTGDPSGQTNLFPGEPKKLPKGAKGAPPPLGKLESHRFDDDGGGNALTSGSCLGVEGHRRYFVVDYSGAAGVPAVFVVAETSKNGRVWRLNTPEFNAVSTAGNSFTLRGPTGSSLTGVVLNPAKPTFRTGTVERGGGAGHTGFPYRGKKYINNKWIEFDCDGQALVIMTLQPAGAAAPKVTGTGSGAKATIQVGPKTISFGK